MKDKKIKYADTIRHKVDAAKQPPMQKTQKPVFFLYRWNAILWPLLISPLFTLLYSPINRYITLPLFGSGRPYEDMDGTLIETYFSANSVARILFYLLLLATELLLIKTTHGISRRKRIALLITATLLNLVMGAVFLEFTLWE
ncbi:MAG: hypothetical protein E7604_04875 [Ruminococcaceae bacterium]|nr:hypothetical protein [Oscillospiraceae bacterium]